MRTPALVLAVIVALAVAATSARAALAAETTHQQSGPAIVAQQVDNHDDSRVGVQLVVAGVVAGLVVGVGSLAYAVRWKLGRTKYDRDAAEKALAHH